MTARPTSDLSAEPFGWLRHLAAPLILGGVLAIDPAAWRTYAVVAAVLIVVAPFSVQLTEDVEINLTLWWTSAAAAYVVGFAVLPIVYLSSVLGFFWTAWLERIGLVRATGVTGEALRRYRGDPSGPDSYAGGVVWLFLYLGALALRAAVSTTVARIAPDLPFVITVVAGETAVSAWLRVVPFRGDLGPESTRAKLAASLGRGMPVIIDILGVVMTCFVLLSFYEGGPVGFTIATVATLSLGAVLKRLADAHLESERQRVEQVGVQTELDRRRRLAAIGQTASGVFHQISRQHGEIGIFAHLLARRAPNGDGSVQEQAGRILASLADARRLIDQLLRFGQDRALNLYPQSVCAVVDEAVSDCGPHASRRGVVVTVEAAADSTVIVDKHKLKQALGNVLDNAIDATPSGGRVDIRSTVDGRTLRVDIRDYGPGVDPAVRPRLFTPFVTTKPEAIGLGLALARELLEAHGGTIAWREATPGTVFELSLPVASDGRRQP